MSTRDDLAAALNGTGLVDAKTGRPDVMHPLTAWPQWTRSTVLTGCALERTWWVLVVLPSGTTATTEDTAEELEGPLLDALLDVGVVDAVEPVEIPIQNQAGSAVAAMRFTVRTSN